LTDEESMLVLTKVCIN